jgi:hypothetical protein
MTMKHTIQKTFLVLFISIISVATQAQIQHTFPAAAEKFVQSPAEIVTPELTEQANESSSRATIWQNNFDDASQWTIDGPTGFNTQFGFSVVNTGLSWAFTGVTFNSESGGNYARFQNGNPSATPATGLSAGGFTLTYSTPIEINNAATVLEFNQYGARFSEFQAVQISIDNGTNWITIGNNDDLPRLTSNGGTSFSNPMKRRYNIFPYTNGNNVSSILLRFFWDGQLNGQNMSYISYGWFIDDLKIMDAPNNDVKLNNLLVDFFFEGSGYYTRIPNTQQGDIGFRGAVLNNGLQTQNDVKMNVIVRKGNTEVYNEESNIISNLPPLGVDTLLNATPFVASGNGTYSINTTISQQQTDEFTTDNVLPAARTFIVNDTVFARDNGTTNASRISLTDYTDANGPGSRLVSVFEFTKPDEIKSLSVYVNSNTASIGASFKAVLYKLTSQIELVLESDIYDIVGNSSMGRWVTLQFNTDGLGEIVPEEGADYFAGIEIVNGSQTNNVFVASESITRQPERTTYIYVAGGSAPGWFFITPSQPLIRLNVRNQSSSIAKADIGLNAMNLMPNPSVEQTTLVYELSKASKVNVAVTNILGQVILQDQLGFQTAGNQQYNINTESLSSGVYHVTIETQNGKLSQKLIVR